MLRFTAISVSTVQQPLNKSTLNYGNVDIFSKTYCIRRSLICLFSK